MPRKLLVEEANRIYFFYKVLLLLVIDRSFHNEGGCHKDLTSGSFGGQVQIA